MDFWSRMLSSIADTVLPKDLDDDTLLLQMDEALQEEKRLWYLQQNFLDPCLGRNFQDKWYSAYCSAKKKTSSILFSDDMRKEQYTCPLCGGRLVRRSGPYGDFFGCSNYKANGCRYKRNISKSKAQRTVQ